MKRVLGIIFDNWPLKLGAVAFATLLYAGLIVSSSAKAFDGAVPIETTGLSSNVTILSDLGAVRTIRYLAPENLGLRLDSSSFRAVVDLSKVPATGGRTSVPVRVIAVDPRIQVLDYEPRQITVQLDQVITRTVPIRAVLTGPIPSGLDIGQPTLSATATVISGAASLVNRVVEAQARTNVDASGIDINRTVDLLPVDSAGNPVLQVDLVPATVRVSLVIFTNRQTRSVPVRPVVTGTPAVGFEIASVIVSPLVVSIKGSVAGLTALEYADTAPVVITGASSAVTLDVPLQLPDGIQAPGVATVRVTVTLRPVTATRTFNAGLVLVGARADRVYALSVDRVLVTIGGSVADLDRLSGTTIVMTIDVSGLAVGPHDVNVTSNLQTGLTMIGASPNPIRVTISAPPTTPSPTTSPAPSPSV